MISTAFQGISREFQGYHGDWKHMRILGSFRGFQKHFREFQGRVWGFKTIRFNRLKRFQRCYSDIEDDFREIQECFRLFQEHCREF